MNWVLEKVLLVLLLLALNIEVSAQMSFVDSINKKITFYDKSKSSSILFVHLDKTIYTANENIWFAAYLLDDHKHLVKPDVLSYALVDDNDRSVLLNGKFLMKYGISASNILIPDSISAGNYSLFFFTNRLANNKVEDTFIQHITIVSSGETGFKVSLNKIDSELDHSKGTKLLLTAYSKNNQPLSGARITFTDKAIKSGEVTTDKQGKYILTIPSSQLNSANNHIKAQVQYNGYRQSVELFIPMKNNINVGFFPEGGNLVDGIQSSVGLEARYNGQPLMASGILYKNSLPIDTIQTDRYGMGKFKITPNKGSNYIFKIAGSEFKDTLFKLPDVVGTGPVINLANAISNDTLDMKLTSRSPEMVTVLIHNYRQLFYAFQVMARPEGKKMLIATKNVPKGLATITVLDSKQRPTAERLFFAHYNQRNFINIQTDKTQYGKREKVKVTLKLNFQDTGLISIACVKNNRVQSKNSNDIESYKYLNHELNSIPLMRYMSGGNEEKMYLENILLIKGWRRYNWQEMMNSTASDTSLNENLITLNGIVDKQNKAVKKPVDLLVVADSTTTILTTDQGGHFQLNDKTVIGDKKIRLTIVDKNKSEYKIKVDDPYLKMEDKIKYDLQLNSTDYSKFADEDSSFSLKGLEHVISLNEVKITSKRDGSGSFYSVKNGFGPSHANICGDYVCHSGYLNCTNHPNDPDNVPAVPGKTYKDMNGSPIVYNSCIIVPAKDNNESITINGIRYNRQFYGLDYTQENSQQPEYLSTIFWKYNIEINSVKAKELTFYTSDIIGNYQIIVQGITKKDVVYSEKNIEVR